ncbi:MAG: T9SS type A sorting domain-containing protein [Saprospiraceae bacterium]|nr:T9SS type A sorting domain-containing protein [Saprospiraceae bacterium]
MMKTLHRVNTILFFLISFTVAWGQGSLELTPNPAIAAVLATDNDVPAKASLTNTSDHTITVRWIRKIMELSMGWQTAVCDKNACYIPSIDTMLLELAAGETSNMDIHIYPNGVPGQSSIELTIVDVDDSDNKVVGMYLFNQTSAVKETIRQDDVKIYPNPATEYFKVETRDVLAKIDMYNIVGDRVKTFYAYRNKRYYVDDLPDGLYLVRLIDVNNRVIKTLRLNKR